MAVLQSKASQDDLLARIAALEAENAKLKANGHARVTMKVSEKGALSVYGLGRFGRTQHVQCRYARHCRPAGVEEHITRRRIASEPGRSRVWPSAGQPAVRIGKVRSRSR